MKVLKILLAVVSGILLSVNASNAQTQSLSVDEIVQKSNHMALYQGIDGKGTVSMTITDKQGRTRKRVFNMLRKDDGDSDTDQKYFVLFKKPADIRKMVFMVHKHAASGKDDDRWLYMPSLDLVKRIAASDKRTSFVGSDFLYEDISGRNPAEDTHELIRTTDSCYVLKNTPKNTSSVEFKYYVAHIDKKTFLPMKIEYFKNNDRVYRVIESLKVVDVEANNNGAKEIYPTVVSTVAKDLEKGTKSEMTFSKTKYNIGLNDNIFTERYLRRPPRNAMR
jgi:outer membrane lipoprotein-sorting protein